MRPLLTATFCLALTACADDPALTIRLQAPASLSLASAQGALQVALLDGDTGQKVVSAAPAPASLAGRQKLFSQLDLTEDRRYSVRVVLNLASQDQTCGGGGRVVGQSPVFRFSKELGHVTIYVACADSFGQVESLKRERLYHTATFLPTPRPHGQVLVVGGGKLNLSEVEGSYAKEDLRASIETFDPDSGTFRLLSATLSQARLYHRATAVDDRTLLITGGAGAPTGTLVPVRLVERLRDGKITGLHSMVDTRAFHTADLLSPTLMLLWGGLSAEKGMLKTAELFDPRAEVQRPMTATPAFHRSSAVSVPYAGGKKVLLFGGHRLAARAAVLLQGRALAAGPEQVGVGLAVLFAGQQQGGALAEGLPYAARRDRGVAPLAMEPQQLARRQGRRRRLEVDLGLLHLARGDLLVQRPVLVADPAHAQVVQARSRPGGHW